MTPQSNAERLRPRDFLLLQLTLFIYATVSIFAKLASGAMTAGDRAQTVMYLAMELAALAVYTVLWQQTLRRMPLNVAYSSKGVCTLWTCLFGLCFFGETLTWGKAIGIVVVLIGVTLVVTDHE